MPTAPITLSNCYIPLPTASSISKTGDGRRSIDPNRRSSGDGNLNSTRNSKAIRRLCLDRSILSSSSGSSLVELGHTKVLCSVHGPRPAISSSLSGGGKAEFHTQGILNAEVRYAPQFGIRPESKVLTSMTNLDGFTLSTPSIASPEEVELSSRLQDAISASIPLDLLVKSVVDIFVMVLQNDGSTFPATVMAASLALADAGIELFDMCSSCSVAVIPKSIPQKNLTASSNNRENGQDSYYLLTDPDEEEILAADGIITLAILPNWKEVTFWDQTGRLPPNVASVAAELCRDGCNTMHKFMRKSLVS